MSLSGKIVRKIETQPNRDAINKVICGELHLLADMSPELVQGVDLLTGEWGTTGSTILWRFTDHEGKQKTSKEVLESVDKENKTVVFKTIDGDLFEHFKTFNYIYNGDVENNYVAWTIEYEKLHADVEDPEWMMDFCVKLIKDIENYHIQGQ